MKLPAQAPPVQRSPAQTRAPQSSALETQTSTISSSDQSGGLQPSTCSECYNLPTAAQQLCLYMC
jgi:hypothetical protein